MSAAPTLGPLLARAADRDATGQAIRDQGVALGWAEAAESAGRMGRALQEIGVGRGDRVGVHHRKCADGFLAMHAVVQQGAVAVPLDPQASAGYLASVVARTGCETVMTHEPCRATATGLVRDAGIRAVIGLGATGEQPEGTEFFTAEAVADLEPASPLLGNPEAPAYIITTSGSTGTPKGICHTHRSALAYVAFKREAYDFDSADRFADIAPNHFDISTQALWVTPSVGATNVVIPEPYQMLPASLSQLLADEAVTVWYGVPYLLTQLLSRGDLDRRDLSALRWVQFGGELLAPIALAELMRKLPGVRFSNVYGPAEVNACTVHHLDRSPSAEEPIPIGRPVSETKVRLVEVDGPIAASPTTPEAARTGEIWVAGPTMMAGYWGQPSLDEAAFATDVDGERWYRTGDLAHRTEDGTLVFTGRVDLQVKIRGYRVELESIEAVLEDRGDVATAVVAAVRGDDGANVLVAGIVAEGGAGLDVEKVRTDIAGSLPHYAVPATFHPLETLPVTGSGKLDRRAIRHTLAQHHQRRLGATNQH